MADETTTSRTPRITAKAEAEAERTPDDPFGPSSSTDETKEAVRAALDNLKKAMIADGQDPALVDVRLQAAAPAETNIVGNYADLQRLGAQQVTGVVPTVPGEEDKKTTDSKEAFVDPRTLVTPAEAVGSASRSAEEAAADAKAVADAKK